MNDTPNLALPYILASQAQKHVTHNEAIRALDCLVQLSVESRSLAAPPVTPSEGSRHIVAATATGGWSGQSEKIAAFQDGAWAFYEPKEGWTAWVVDDHEVAIYSAGAWASFAGGGGGGTGPITELDDLDHLGINATADTTNVLSLKGPASLFDNSGNGHQQKINKHAAGDTASVLYQTNYSGRAEMGLTGDDDFHFKVSTDGATWREALKIDRGSGRISYPVMGGPREMLSADRTYFVRTDGNDANSGLANTSAGAFLTIQRAFNVIAGTLDLGGFNVTIQIGDGTYAGGLSVSQPWTGGGNITVRGNNSTPDNVVVQSTVSISTTLPGILAVRDFKSTATTAIQHNGVGVLQFANITIAGSATPGTVLAHIIAGNPGAIIRPFGSYRISGGGQIAHIWLTGGFFDFEVGAVTVTLSGTPAFSMFISVVNCGAAIFRNVTFSGSATGSRYSAGNNGVIDVNGAGTSYFPGSSAGSAATGGQYV